MTTGTITLDNKSTAVTGSGTTFTTDLAVGGFIVATVGGTPYTLGIQAIGSDTSLTLTKAYDGPTTSGVAFDYVPLATLNLITSALASQVSYAIRGLNLDKNNWQLVFSESGDITITIPDGTTFTGPSWKKISDLLAGIDPDALQQIADQIAADAQQVATDRADVDTKAAQASNDASTATQAASDAADANTSAQSAKTDAVAAKVDAEAARDAAQSANPDNQLKKANNLSDVADADAARNNIGAVGVIQANALIQGLPVAVGTSTITVGTGSARLQGGSLLTVGSSFTYTLPSLTASTWYHIYLYDNAGTVAVEVSTTAPVAYNYPAHRKGSDQTRRYIGSLVTNSSGVPFRSIAMNGLLRYQFAYQSLQSLAGFTSTNESAVAINNGVPDVVSQMIFVNVYNSETSAAAFLYSAAGNLGVFVIRAGAELYFDIPLTGYPYVFVRYNSAASGTGMFLNIMGYTYAR